MPKYIENPKTTGSGVVCCIPQTTACPIGCADCFFNGNRSYLCPLDQNLPNMPDPAEVERNGWVVRVNDGNDSNVDREDVVKAVRCYPRRFYNTSIPKDLDKFDAPVVLTLNPGRKTDSSFHRVDPVPPNLMFCRFRTNTWNWGLAGEAARYYEDRGVPLVLTFMAYFETAEEAIPEPHRHNYVFRKRTLNSYWAITTDAWRRVMGAFEPFKRVYSCGHVEGELGDTKCRFCGNCLREFFATNERMREQAGK
jgi:hypothetical protein